MTDAQDTTPDVVEDQTDEVTQPHESESARYLRIRRESKARAEETVKANAKAAQAAKRKAQAKAPTVPGAADFAKRAKAIEEAQAKLRADREADSK